MSLYENRQDFVAKLAVELDPTRVTSDPRNVNPPCVFIDAPDNLLPGPCGTSGDLAIWIIAAGPANEDALPWLLDTYEQVRPFVITDRPFVKSIYYNDPSATNGQPAYQGTTLLNS